MSSLVNFDSTACYNAAVGDCYQAVHGVWALANGGLFGLGLGNSREKYGWLPAKSNDYIFAILGEELGLIGVGLLVVLAGLPEPAVNVCFVDGHVEFVPTLDAFEPPAPHAPAGPPRSRASSTVSTASSWPPPPSAGMRTSTSRR